MVKQVQATVGDVQEWLVTGPLHLQQTQITQYFNEVVALIEAQRTAITGTVLTAGAVAVEVLASIVLLLFVTFFLLKDGDRIWGWFLKGFGRMSPRVDRAGRAAWSTLSHYVQGSVLVAAVHGVVMGIVLARHGGAALGAAGRADLPGQLHPDRRHLLRLAPSPPWSRSAPRASCTR
ncbi:AI-2E family transporter [Nonomuraea ferruginea]